MEQKPGHGNRRLSPGRHRGHEHALPELGEDAQAELFEHCEHAKVRVVRQDGGFLRLVQRERNQRKCCVGHE